MCKAVGTLQDLTTSSGLPTSEDSSVRQAIEDVLARVNLADDAEPEMTQERPRSVQEKPPG